MPILPAHDREVLDYLCRAADAALIASLPSARLRVLAQCVPVRPYPQPSWKGNA